MSRSIASLAALLLIGTSGCVYYNAVYNADRLADDARRAEREGRVFEAQSLWGRTAVKADSIVSKHPKSKWYDDALVLRAEAYAGSGRCEGQTARLTEAVDRASNAEQRERAALAVGKCFVAMGDPDRAVPLLTQAAASKDQDRRESASLLLGVALRQTGRGLEGADVLSRVPGSRARVERMLAFAAAGQTDSAMSIAHDVLIQGDTLARWDSLLGLMGQHEPTRASAWLDTLRASRALKDDQIASLMAEDAARLRGSAPDLAADRLREVATLQVTSDAITRAQMQLIMDAVTGASTPDDLRNLTDSLTALVARTGAPSAPADLQRRVSLVLALSDSSAPDKPTGDLQRFLGAEIARDSLGAPRLAAGMFVSVAEVWPESPFAGKALLAARALDDSAALRTEGWVENRFASNPYVALLAGGDGGAVQQLEDSLAAFTRTFASAQAATKSTTTPGRRPDGRPANDPARRGRVRAPVE